MKKILLILVAIISSGYAEREFSLWVNNSKLVGRCEKAQNSSYKLAKNYECLYSVNLKFNQKIGEDLAKKAKYEKYHPVTFWIEEFIAYNKNKYESKWKKISKLSRYKYNGFSQPITFKAKATNVYRLAVDYRGQTSYSDDNYNEFKIYVNN